MQVSPSIAVLLCTVAIVVAQEYDAKPPSYDGPSSYDDDDKKQPDYYPPPHSSKKHDYGGNGDSYGYGGYGDSYGYGGYGGYNQGKHYESCKPDYDSYSDDHRSHLKYLESGYNDYKKNSSYFKPHPDIKGVPHPPCEKGSKYVLHSVPYEWHWPPVYRGVCDGLPGCKDHKCIPRKTVKKSLCVLVFRHHGKRWVKVGYRKIVVKSDVSCKCRECRDIESYRECVNTHPCPNKEGGPYSFCFWRRPYQYSYYGDDKTQSTYPPKHRDRRDTDDDLPELDDIDSETVSIDESEFDDVVERSKRMTEEDYDSDDYDGDKKDSYDTDSYKSYSYPRCDCCEPKLCKPLRKFDYDICECVCHKRKCLPGLKLNLKTCECECPKGTYLDKKKQRCVGICKKLSPKDCETVLCKDNPHLYCDLDKNYKCRCPSCDDIDKWQKGLCKKTNCIEQGYKPYCVFDWKKGNCRCPECEDQENHKDCEKTSCIDPYKNTKKCKWTWYPYATCKCVDSYSSHDTKPDYPPSHGGYGDDDKKTEY